MYAAAGLVGLGFIYNLIGSHWLVIGYGYAPGLNRGALGSVAGPVASITSTASASVLGIALWLWMASANRAGRSWGRITSTVLFIIDTLATAMFLPTLRFDWHLASRAGGPLSAVLAAGLSALGVWVLGLMIIVLLWRRESSAYYAAMAADR